LASLNEDTNGRSGFSEHVAFLFQSVTSWLRG
jgi:hypothetical protein